MPADPIRVALIGAGHWGPNLIRSFHDNPRSEVAWVIDKDPARVEGVRQRFPGVRTGDDAELALSDPDVHAVVVATPTIGHYALTKSALSRGKHVLVEKPLTRTSAEGEELCELAASRQLVLLVGHVFLYNGAVRRVKQYLADGELGRVFYVSMVRTNLGPIRMDVNAAWDLASHDLSIVGYWVDSEPISVSAIGGTWINEGLADTVFATLRYPGDVLVNLHVSWLNPRKARDVTVVGDRRMLTFDDMSLSEPIRIYDKQVTDTRGRPGFIDTFGSFRLNVRDGDIIIPKVSNAEPLRAETENFLASIDGTEKPVSDGRRAVAVVRALEAMDRSMRNAGREEAVRA